MNKKTKPYRVIVVSIHGIPKEKTGEYQPVFHKCPKHGDVRWYKVFNSKASWACCECIKDDSVGIRKPLERVSVFTPDNEPPQMNCPVCGNDAWTHRNTNDDNKKAWACRVCYRNNLKGKLDFNTVKNVWREFWASKHPIAIFNTSILNKYKRKRNSALSNDRKEMLDSGLKPDDFVIRQSGRGAKFDNLVKEKKPKESPKNTQNTINDTFGHYLELAIKLKESGIVINRQTLAIRRFPVAHIDRILFHLRGV